MKTLFAPGCALRAYKPARVEALGRFLRERGLADGEYLPCCKAEERPEGVGQLITCCPGCSAHFAHRCPGTRVVSLWRVLLETDFPFPDYGGERMTVHDACPARGRDSAEMREASRLLLKRMNICVVEPADPPDGPRCCGGSAGTFEERRRMAMARAAELPEKNVAVYCTGCARSFSVTEAVPRHLLDLLFCERTEGLYPPGMPEDFPAGRTADREGT